ncbi:MAG: hypothetical protein NT030_08375, partial [Candidatus Saganbacteria bacterium]|nr:hypothetical protein [Candidatus Saganbacteria bacterium]
MVVNLFVDQAGTQGNAVALNQGLTQELKLIDKEKQKLEGADKEKEAEKPQDTKGKSETSKLLDAKKNDQGTMLLARLASNVASLGVKLSPENFASKMESKIKDEYDLMFKNGENSEDQVLLKDVLTVARKGHREGEGGKGKGGEEGGPEVKNPQTTQGVLEYSSLLSQFIVSGGTDIKKKLEEIETQFRSSGMTEQDLLGLQKNIRNSMRAEIASQIREHFLNRTLSKEKTIEWTLHSKALNNVLDFAFFNKKLGGWHFGGYNASLQGTMNEQMRQVIDEVKDFVREEIERTMVKMHLDGNTKQGKEEITELIKLGSKVGFNPDQFLKDFQDKRIHLGMNPFTPPQHGGGNEGGSKREQDKTGYEFNQDDEKELLVNQLRALYMQRALKGDLRTVIDTSFKIRRLQNGLIKLGVQFGEFRSIEKEGRAVAKLKVMEMLKQVLLERATLYDLSGPAFKLVERKVKGLLNNLARLDMVLSKAEFETLRDAANTEIHDQAVEELSATNAVLEIRANPQLEKKQKHLIKLINRLREESGIGKELDEKIEDLLIRGSENLKLLKE